MRDAVLRGGHAGVLVAVTGVAAWATSQPFVFPSLGPTAFMLALGDVGGGKRRRAYTVVGGHFVGVVAGLVSYSLFAPGAAVTSAHPALSAAEARLGLSGVSSVGLTTGGMVATDSVHAPACATTLIVSLGILSSPSESAVMMSSVVVVFAADEAVRRATE